jgi:hypothetical protein
MIPNYRQLGGIQNAERRYLGINDSSRFSYILIAAISPKTIIAHIAMQTSDEYTIHVEINSNLSVTHAACQYVTRRYEALLRLETTDVILPPVLIDAYLVIACDRLVDRFLAASQNKGKHDQCAIWFRFPFDPRK